jgi:hypothetical protein
MEREWTDVVCGFAHEHGVMRTAHPLATFSDD